LFLTKDDSAYLCHLFNTLSTLCKLLAARPLDPLLSGITRWIMAYLELPILRIPGPEHTHALDFAAQCGHAVLSFSPYAIDSDPPADSTRAFFSDLSPRVAAILAELAFLHAWHVDLNTAFVSQWDYWYPIPVPLPPDTPALLRHLLRLARLTPADLELADESPMDYWWRAVKPDATDRDLRARVRPLFKRIARNDYAAASRALDERPEDVFDLEVVMHFTCILIRISPDPAVVQRAVALIGGWRDADELPLAPAWRLLLVRVVQAAPDPDRALVRLALDEGMALLGSESPIAVTVAYRLLAVAFDVSRALPGDVVGVFIDQAPLCLTADAFALLGAVCPAAAVDCLIQDVVNDQAFMRDEHQQCRVLDRLAPLGRILADGECVARPDALESLAEFVAAVKEEIIESDTTSLFPLLGGLMVQFHRLGRLEEVFQFAVECFNDAYVDDFAECVAALLRLDWDALRPERVLAVILPVLDADGEPAPSAFTLACRLTWSVNAECTAEVVAALRSHVAKMANNKERQWLRAFLIDELVLTMVARGIEDMGAMKRCLAIMRRGVATNYMRRLAIFVAMLMMRRFEDDVGELQSAIENLCQGKISKQVVGAYRFCFRQFGLAAFDFFPLPPALRESVPPGFVECDFMEGSE
jgi:hypothetical protein